MISVRNSFLASVTAILLAFSSCGRATPPADTGTSAEIGAPAPDFVLGSIDGTNVRLSDFRGKVVFLNFWASWCPPCRAEMPSIENLKKRMEGYDFVILAVSIDDVERSRLSNFVEGNGYTFTILHDPEQTVADTYLIMGIPTTYIIDKNGTVVDKSVGMEPWDSSDRIEEFMSMVE